MNRVSQDSLRDLTKYLKTLVGGPAGIQAQTHDLPHKSSTQATKITWRWRRDEAEQDRDRHFTDSAAEALFIEH